MKFNYYLWFFYIIAFPFYVFAEGNPQIADVFGGLIILSSIRPILQNLTKNSFTRYALYFVVYALIVNTIWMIILKDLIIIKFEKAFQNDYNYCNGCSEFNSRWLAKRSPKMDLVLRFILLSQKHPQIFQQWVFSS